MNGLFKLVMFTISVGITSSSIESEYNKTKASAEFIPQLPMAERSEADENEEWRKLSKDEAVPAGSHVKINLETGEKLIKRNVANEKKILKVGKESSWYDVKQSIKEIKYPKEDSKKKSSREVDYRKLEVILEELAEYEFPAATEDDVLKQLLLIYGKANIATKLKVLNDIEFLVHKYSFGTILVRLHGIALFIDDAYNSTNTTLRAMITLTLGSAMQGNDVVKEAILKNNWILVLLENLKSGDEILQLRSAFALSTLLRNHHGAQDEFIAQEGYGVFVDILNRKYNPSVKLIQKILTLLLDLLDENDPLQYTKEELDDLDLIALDVESREYNLHAAMAEFDICSALLTFFPHEDQDVMHHAIKITYKLRYFCTRALIKAFSLVKFLMVTYARTDTQDPQFSEALTSFSELYDYLDKINEFIKSILPKDEL